jgi:hypothetical protein
LVAAVAVARCPAAVRQRPLAKSLGSWRLPSYVHHWHSRSCRHKRPAMHPWLAAMRCCLRLNNPQTRQVQPVACCPLRWHRQAMIHWSLTPTNHYTLRGKLRYPLDIAFHLVNSGGLGCQLPPNPLIINPRDTCVLACCYWGVIHTN